MTPDEPRAVRGGEELPLEPLRAFLARELPGLDGDLAVQQFPSGYSNLTYLLRVGRRELVLRRPPKGADVKGGHDMGREHEILAALAPVWPKVPRPLAYCDDPAVIGAPFYVMERVGGVILRDARSAASLDAGGFRRLSEALVEGLAELHGLDHRACGLTGLGRPEGYVERQVGGWAERWRRSRTDDLPAVEAAADWLAAHRPPDSAPALIHNDYKYDNVVFDPERPGRIRAVLDWEMATIGDPLMDLGTSLAYWADPDDPPGFRGIGLLELTQQPGNLSRAQVVERYARLSGRDSGDAVFYYVFGLFKLAVIVQQIYARYRKGLTQDPRFAGLLHVAAACGAQAQRAIALGRIGRLAEA